MPYWSARTCTSWASVMSRWSTRSWPRRWPESLREARAGSNRSSVTEPALTRRSPRRILAAGGADAQITRAEAVCAGCAVRQECLDFAIQTNQEYGVWGGAAEDERRGMRRAWRAAERRRRLAG